MSDLTATIRVQSPDLALTETVANTDAATIKPVSSAGTAPNLGAYLFTVRTDDFEQFETALERDHTIDSFERVVERGPEAVYSFQYDSEATVFSAAISAVNGVSLDWTNDDTVWIVRVWLPDREALESLWDYAVEHDVEFTLDRVYDYAGIDEADSALTKDQREILLLALEMGYFEEPRTATLSEVAAELGISQPAAGGRLRRGLRRLVESAVAAPAEKLRD
ncbi:helix-turn-helix domain-containing protein [Halobellus sp. EA9]|uniref:helix-turn-helix domain-containing protein n=1 Tax=Halobellus sp. EA9 TaxID=3421647 RepID=UPI003EB936FE